VSVCRDSVPGEFSGRTTAKIAGSGRKRHTSDPEPCSERRDGQPLGAKCLKMASSSGETVGQRGGGGGPSQQHQRGADRAGERAGVELSSSSSSNTSKKKQKERANQESREAKRAAVGAGGVIAEAKKGECWMKGTYLYILTVNPLVYC